MTRWDRVPDDATVEAMVALWNMEGVYKFEAWAVRDDHLFLDVWYSGWTDDEWHSGLVQVTEATAALDRGWGYEDPGASVRLRLDGEYLTAVVTSLAGPLQDPAWEDLLLEMSSLNHRDEADCWLGSDTVQCQVTDEQRGEAALDRLHELAEAVGWSVETL